MSYSYSSVTTRFLHPEERLIISEETEMPLVIEPKEDSSLVFLNKFLSDHAQALHKDLAKYGAILLRGFDITSEKDFQTSVLSLEGMTGISEAFMSEEGRVPVGDLSYVLHTNAVYKTGVTLYLGGFHNENYYSADVPSFISFCCLKPSKLGGETGLINMEKVYACMSDELKQRLEKKSFFVSKWLLSEIASRYQVTVEQAEACCQQFDIPCVGKGKKRFALMYKPSVYLHPITQKKALQINFFELLPLNRALRACFMKDYQGQAWFWHRLVWRLPERVFKMLEHVYVMFASFFIHLKTR
ncbi:MAG: TauD/TfdA family dioxygenase [Legionellaceae bacterium]